MNAPIRRLTRKQAQDPLPIDATAREKFTNASLVLVEMLAVHGVEQLTIQGKRGVHRISITAVSQRGPDCAGNYQRSSLPGAGRP